MIKPLPSRSARSSAVRLLIVAESACAADAIHRRLRHAPPRRWASSTSRAHALRPCAEASQTSIIIDRPSSGDGTLAVIRELRAAAPAAELLLLTTQMDHVWIARRPLPGLTPPSARRSTPLRSGRSSSTPQRAPSSAPSPRCTPLNSPPTPRSSPSGSSDSPPRRGRGIELEDRLVSSGSLSRRSSSTSPTPTAGTRRGQPDRGQPLRARRRPSRPGAARADRRSRRMTDVTTTSSRSPEHGGSPTMLPDKTPSPGSSPMRSAGDHLAGGAAKAGFRRRPACSARLRAPLS